MPFVQIGDETIFYQGAPGLCKPDPAMGLIPIHGSGGCGSQWPSTLRHLPQVETVIPDLPAHGRSSGLGRDSVAAYADFVEAFVTALDLRRVILMGHSLGGAIALTSALRSPDWLRGLILVGTGARLRVTRAILDGILTDYQQAVAIICALLFGNNASPDLIETVRMDLQNAVPEVVHGDFSACDHFDIMADIERIHVPTLILSGNLDKLTPPNYGEYLHNNIPNSRHVIIDDAGHMMALEKTDDFITAIADFLAPLLIPPPPLTIAA